MYQDRTIYEETPDLSCLSSLQTHSTEIDLHQVSFQSRLQMNTVVDNGCLEGSSRRHSLVSTCTKGTTPSVDQSTISDGYHARSTID